MLRNVNYLQQTASRYLEILAHDEHEVNVSLGNSDPAYNLPQFGEERFRDNPQLCDFIDDYCTERDCDGDFVTDISAYTFARHALALLLEHEDVEFARQSLVPFRGDAGVAWISQSRSSADWMRLAQAHPAVPIDLLAPAGGDEGETCAVRQFAGEPLRQRRLRVW